ncbi:DUF2177 family protein [Thiorhodovibrio frisius]|uniref:Putative membrane protein n=1 Tax=Thiorhodovibrio frisius TaxID=631362 RepID=H8Z1F4_9GAMM|nr:DUF2177 family protein [Thiorhodovibrio frisius]EIC22503.1 putative membrane protein [Thiorhodovibrio frisius]WPL24803.1 putative membrane protein [Thiorhodovibrio frisius]
MTVRYYIKLYLLTVPVFFALDMFWLGWLAVDFYQEQIGHLLAGQVNWLAALAFYCIYIAGILIFAVLPGLKRQSLVHAATVAPAFGFFTYSTYELTNMATLPDWPLTLVLVDTLWGMLLCTSVASLSYLIGRWLLRAGHGGERMGDGQGESSCR